MKKFSLSIFVIACLVAVAVSFFRVIDAALEIDDLKTGGDFIFRRMDDLIVITNASFRSCNMKVEEFERVVNDAGISLNPWTGETALVGSFKVTRKGDCVTHIEFSR